MRIHSIGAEYFWHTIRIKPKTVLKSKAVTNESEYPYRTSESTVYRLWPLNRALVTGKWAETGRTEDEALRSLLTTDYAVTGYEGSGITFGIDEVRDFT
jgi:hypothetical protein